MPTIINIAEGGSNGVAATTANTGGGSGIAPSSVTTGSSQITFSSARSSHGSLSYEYAYAASSQANMIWVLSSTSRVVLRFYVYISALPTSGVEYLGSIRHSGGNMCIAAIGSDRKFSMQNASGGGIAASKTAIDFPTNSWTRVEIAAAKGTTTANGTIEYAIYTGDQTTAIASWSSSAQNTSTNNPSHVLVGRTTNATESRTVYYDSIKAQDIASGWVGPGPDSVANSAPVADLGAGVTGIEPYSTVTLDGSASSDSDGTITSYSFTQLVGPTVTLQGSGSSRTYRAPAVRDGTLLRFGLTVTDNGGAVSSQAAVNHTVLPATEFAVIAGVEVPIDSRGVVSGAI